MKPFLLSLVLLVIFCDFANCDDGLCGIEPPKAGETCSGGDTEGDSDEKGKGADKSGVLKYDYEEKPMTPEETEIWEKRLYPKIKYVVWFLKVSENKSLPASLIPVCFIFLLI
jgi:hypothetical protein